MKKTHNKLILLFILFLTVMINPNPIALPFISEIKIDSTDFSIEINEENFWGNTFDGWYLFSQTDTVAIDSGIFLRDSTYNPLYEEFVVLTRDNLTGDFYINPEGDEIGLGYYNYHESIPVFDKAESVCFGTYENSIIGVPRPSQTICFSEEFWYYLDSSPTLGMANDTEGAIGYLDGFVVDSSGNLQPNYSFVFSYSYYGNSYRSVTTDQDGYFIIESIAKRVYLHRKENGKIGAHLMTRQIYPEDTTQVTVNIDNFTGIQDEYIKSDIQGFILKPSYPNPFNSSTAFSYQLPYADYVKISVFNVSGKLVDVLYKGYKNEGSHKITWRPGSAVASGLYFYRLQTSELILHKKCLYIK